MIIDFFKLRFYAIYVILEIVTKYSNARIFCSGQKTVPKNVTFLESKQNSKCNLTYYTDNKNIYFFEYLHASHLRDTSEISVNC